MKQDITCLLCMDAVVKDLIALGHFGIRNTYNEKRFQVDILIMKRNIYLSFRCGTKYLLLPQRINDQWGNLYKRKGNCV